MTARNDLAVLYERRMIGEEPGTARYEYAVKIAGADLDAIAGLATNPETAPAVFAWLVEAGVLAKMYGGCDCDDRDRGGPWHAHYHAVLEDR